MEYMAIGGSLVAILTFVFGAFHYVVLKPLKESIIDLKELINRIQHNVEEDERMRHTLEIKVATLEQRVESIDSKFSIISKYCMETHGTQDLLPLLAQLQNRE